MPGEIEELYDYNRWANERVLSTVSTLTAEELDRDLGSSFPSVRTTLAHILTAEWIWLSRWHGRSPSGTPDAWDLSTVDALRARWDEVERDRRTFLSGLTDEELDREITYRNTKGTEFTAPLRQMLRHVVNHSTYHRGQVATMLRQLGKRPVATDIIAFHRE